MVMSDIFQRFVEDSPVSVMAQALLENALPPSAVDSLFAQHAQLQYTRQLLFSDVVNLMSLVVCGIRPSINAALNKMAGTLTVTKGRLRQDRPSRDDHQRRLRTAHWSGLYRDH